MTGRPYWDERPAVALRTWVLGQMMRGAGYAAGLLVIVALGLYAIYGISLLLPEESKQAPAPNLSQLAPSVQDDGIWLG